MDVQDDGLKAIANLEEALKACDKVVESSDKQAIPSVQQNALTYVGQIEEAMMKGFPFEVPSQYDSLPQLKASRCPSESDRTPSHATLLAQRRLTDYKSGQAHVSLHA